MRYLSQFLAFRLADFLKDKELTVTNLLEHKEYGTGRHLGTAIEVAITRDDTAYSSKSGSVGSNLYEKFIIKCMKDVDVSIGSVVMPKGGHGVVSGEYRNRLTVLCEDIVVMKSE